MKRVNRYIISEEEAAVIIKKYLSTYDVGYEPVEVKVGVTEGMSIGRKKIVFIATLEEDEKEEKIE
jgi:hypothetical protein